MLSSISLHRQAGVAFTCQTVTKSTRSHTTGVCQATLQQQMSRRDALLATTSMAAFTVSSAIIHPSIASAMDSISIGSRAHGTGPAAAQPGDLLMIHYVGTLAENGTIFDSTRGGLKYRDGGDGAFRPAVLKLGGDALPGICPGLAASLVGMHVGEIISVTVPPSLGFGSTKAVLAPYEVVPPGSTLRYEIELVRLSRRGPDALWSGTAQCGSGFVNERTTGCAAISIGEFL